MKRTYKGEMLLWLQPPWGRGGDLDHLDVSSPRKVI